VTAEASVEPTEEEKKVERALLKLFPSGRPEKRVEESITVGLIMRGSELEFLSSLRNLIRQERIRNTARAIFLRGLRDNVLRIYLNKQAAFMGRVSFCAPVGESPHGPISILLESKDMPSVIDYLAGIPVQSSKTDVRRKRPISRPYDE